MALNFCLPPAVVNKFKQGLTSGEINPQKLASMDSAARREFLAKYVGADAAQAVNAEFESKLLLKNQIRGMTTWAKSVAGLSAPARRDLITRISKLDRVLNPEEKGLFLADLAEKKLGVGVSAEEAKTIAGLSNKISEYESKRLPDGTWANKTDEMNYGYAVWDLGDYLSSIKSMANNLTLKDFGKRPIKSTVRVVAEATGVSKSLAASLDLSAFLIQGFKTAVTNPRLWKTNVLRTLKKTAQSLGGKDAMREFQARIYADPMYDLAQKGRLAIGNIEEMFPTQLQEKIPGIGRLYKASDVAYSAFVQQARFDLFKLYVKRLEAKGININDPTELRAIARIANSQLGRGKLPFGFEKNADTFNKLFFAPRFVFSLLDTFTLPVLAETKAAKMIATENLIKEVSAVAGLITAINLFSPGTVETDPRSSKFGKIMIGDTGYDITAKVGSLFTLASRLIPTLGNEGIAQYSKSSSTGEVKKLGSVPVGPQNGLDVIGNWVQGKASPTAQIVLDLIRQQDYLGNPLDPQKEAGKLVLPLSVSSYNDLMTDPNSSNLIIGMMANAIGINTSTYKAKGAGGVPSWQNSTSTDVQQFKAQVGQDTFTNAAKEFDLAYNSWLNGVKNNPDWKNSSADEKTRLMSQESAQLKSDIFARYNFKYKKQKLPPVNKSLLKGLNEVSAQK